MAEEQTQAVEQTQEPVQQEQPKENVSHETQEATTTEPAPRPEYIPEKFWNTDKGEVNMEEFGKSYTNLEKYVGGKKEELRDQIVDELQQEAIAERPEKVEGYELPKLPEGVTEEIVNANPMTEWWKNFCFENAYDQEVFEEGVNKYVDMYVGNQVDVDAEKEKLGENADARLDAVNNWASTFFTPEQYEAISGTLGQSVDGIEALEKMMNANKQTISNAQNFTQPERPLTLEDVRSMMKDKRYFDPKERDESYVKKVDDAFARLYRG
tara:strand:+ start:2468 stop:3271 length:804 start_codon:yes stop_codon:yes gene_type:complete